MLTIGEKLNSSIPKTLAAMQNGDSEYIENMIKLQAERGAGYIDINTALTGDAEIKLMAETAAAVKRLTAGTDYIGLDNGCGKGCGVMLDSPDVSVLEQVLRMTEQTDIIINSVDLAKNLTGLVKTAIEYGASFVCMPSDGVSIPVTAESRLANAEKLSEKLISLGMKPEKLYIDIMVSAAAADTGAGVTALETLRLIKSRLPGVRTIAGLSNISFGLPGRAGINAAFLAMAVQCGLDAAILDMTSEPVRNAFYAAEMLSGNDEYCMNYIEYYRSRQLLPPI